MSWTSLLIAVVMASIGVAALAEPANCARKVIISMDIGDDIDDAFALAFALKSPELIVDAAVVTYGPTAKRGKLTAKLLAAAGREDVPVLIGKPGKDHDYGQLAWATDYKLRRPVVADGARALVRRILRSPEKITLITTGPMTDVAQALRIEPRIKEKIDEVFVMGGSVYVGFNLKPPPCAETNIVLDIKAAQTVFESGLPIVMAGLEVTAMMQPDMEDMRRLARLNQPLPKALSELFQAWGHPIPTFFDVVAVAMAFRNDLVKTEPMRVRVTDEGLTVIVPNEPPNALVGVEVDKPRLMKLFMDRILGR